MAPFVPLTDGARAQLLFSFAGRNLSNDLFFIFDNPPFTATDLQGLADGVSAWYTDELLPYLSSDLLFAAVVTYDASDGLETPVGVNFPSLAGGTASKAYSANVAVRVNFRWPLGVRERLNCSFVPGIPDSGVSLNTLDTTFRNRLWSGYVDLIDRARLFSPFFNWRWVVTSRIDGGVDRSERVWGECEGPVPPGKLKLAQRRKRLG